MAHSNGQQYSTSRMLDTQTTFVANRVNETANLMSQGLDPLQRIDYLDITIRCVLDDAAAAATTITFTDNANRDAFLDCIFSNIRFYSSTVGDVIRNLSFSELAFLVQRLNADFLQSDLGVPGQTVNFLTGSTATINLSVPFRNDNPSIVSQYAPRAAQFSDGGLATTNGSGTFTDSAGVVWVVGLASSVEWRVRGPIVTEETKVSPICFEKYTSANPATLPAGMWLTLDNHTDSAVTGYGATGGASGGMRVSFDGDTVINASDFAPLDRVGSMISEGPDPSAWDTDTTFSSGTANQNYVWNRVGVPIFFLPKSARSFAWPVIEKRLVIEPGTNYSASIDYLACRVKRLSEIADAPRCGAGIPGPGVSLPNPYGGTSEAVRPQNPTTA